MKLKKNKTLLRFGIFIGLLMLFPNVALAATKLGYVDATSGLNIRSDAGVSYKKVGTLSHKSIVNITSSKNTQDSTSTSQCPTKLWYYVSDGKISGYACSSYIVITDDAEVSSSEMASFTDKEFEEYLQKQGFPSSYWNSLKALHKAHPNWVFKADPAKYTWSNALQEENTLKRSLYQVTSTGVKNGLQGYLSTCSSCYNYETDTFTAFDGSTWFQASSETIAYYMDPRNFLTEAGIFMFEDLTYYESYQTEAVVKKILYTDFYKNYTPFYVEAAKKYNVSPIYLAALTRQEVGLESGTATSGKAGTYNGVNYNGYYNFYNIQATSGSQPVYNGLAYAKSVGWNTPQLAIVEGANWIVKGYINQGQYTPYYQKWNTSSTTTTQLWHQYATDVRAKVSPAATTASSYGSIGISNEALVFTIPVYIGMPSSTSLPKTGNPNNWLKSMSIDSKAITNFKGSTTSYNLGEVDYSKSSITISGTTVNSNAAIDGDGKVDLNVGTNTIKVVVTAQNGAQKTYTLTITRLASTTQDSTPTTPTTQISISNILSNLSLKNSSSNIYGFSLGITASTLNQNILTQNSQSVAKITDAKGNSKTGTLATGDKVSITSNSETKKFDVVIYGDLNGDGKINAHDLLSIRKHLLKQTVLSGAYLESAKLNHDSSVSAKDLLTLRKYLLGTTKISQL